MRSRVAGQAGRVDPAAVVEVAVVGRAEGPGEDLAREGSAVGAVRRAACSAEEGRDGSTA